MSVRPSGVGKSAIALMYLLHGRTVSLVILKPENSTSSWAKRNFSGLRVIPCVLHLSSQFAAWKKLSSIVSDQSRVSSTHLVLFGMVDQKAAEGTVHTLCWAFLNLVMHCLFVLHIYLM